MTANNYLTSMKGFTAWSVSPGRRTNIDPLAHLERFNDRIDRRHQRRSLSVSDFNCLLCTVFSGRILSHGLSGRDRFFLYLLAVYSGFRASELVSLTPASFDLTAAKPSVTVLAAYSKHRRDDHQRLRSDVAALLHGFLRNKPVDQPVWPGNWSKHGAEMVRFDLHTAGIPYLDAKGRVFDFRALRGQFITAMTTGGALPGAAQKLARHGDIRLTMNLYTDHEAVDIDAALDKLPPPPPIQDDDEGAA